jgi:GDPmannose 4,6-dehydratase/GDP-4-dehydro-6-deoxy-D-mannose reductase
MRILVTGAAGSGGSYLCEYIVNEHQEVEVHAITRWHSTTTLDNLSTIRDKIKLHECDLLDFSSIQRVLEIVKPDRIFHMASHANVRTCFDTPLAVVYNNVMSTANLFEAIRMTCPLSVIMLCSTSEVYGNPRTVPMKETHPYLPVNPYSASKLSQESLAFAWHQSWGLKIIITRAFAYLNPRRRDLFASSFASQVARIEAGKITCLRHGNLESVRTLMDVRDMAEAYWLACDKCEYATPYNIGGSDVMTVGAFLDVLMSHAKKPIFCIQDSDLLRPKDVTNQVCDSTKFREATGWKQKYSFDESIEFLLDYYRKENK